MTYSVYNLCLWIINYTTSHLVWRSRSHNTFAPPVMSITVQQFKNQNQHFFISNCSALMLKN